MTLENAMWLIMGMGLALVFIVPVAYYVVREERRVAQKEVNEILGIMDEDNV